MSGEGPESIPTSADPRSRRPVKKRALTPVSAQAATLDALFAKPDQIIRIPPSSSAPSSASRRPPPPEIITNVQGSSAGAGSGEFHVYKAARRREYERLREMDEEVKREREQASFDKTRAENERRDQERTRKNRDKRDKARARKANKGRAGDANGDEKKKKENGPRLDPPVGAKDDDGDGGGKSREHGSHARNVSSNEEIDGDSGSATTPAEPVGLIIHDDE